MLVLNSTDACLCGSGKVYADCCQAYHTNQKIPETAEALMRSRYTAYALHNADYLRATWDVKKCPENIDFSRETLTWLRLEVIETKKGGAKDDKGLVTFKAYYEQDGAEYCLHEVSRFIKQNGRWFYLDGAIKSIGAGTVNLGKNAPCSCGSGKKYKRCCGA